MPVSSEVGKENLTASVAPAVRLALQDLKREPPPLGNYEIQLQLLDSQCDPVTSLRNLFDAMWAGPKYLLVFGGVCPSVTALIARALPALRLVQVSFSASSPSLSDRKRYGNLFSTVPSGRALNQATVKLLQHHKWSRVGIITQEGAGLSEMKKDVIAQLLDADLHVVSTPSLSEDVCASVRKLKDRDVRIIIGQFKEDSAAEVFCCAYRLNLFGARYQWIIADGGVAGWRLVRQAAGCTAHSVLMAADGSIRLQIRQLSHTNAPGVSGRTPQDYQDSYRRQLIQEGSKVSPLHTFAYDAVWVAARALSQVMEAVKHREKYSAQRDVSVSGDQVHKMLLEAVKKTQFEGVTGPVFFVAGQRMTSIELIQISRSF
ncbi:gamma-aminobutyric acid type B receptor subunit 2-like isoform X2 [Larimichthys crocea]|uniref:gamma-aminobutyric acid type B receptor subunit 2-like isoform X1 n=1 Tax=Larimichthys crocea TaxID=215358 RepID=UPI000F5D7CC1|nr:gamma-aminobutyric acid type B receptor subunit 2-like isoform X1 [Larimichthys crocea]XP_027131111.1 gamma-aminobutyric acid type B receptor subunit 2-like isoform X2 [Larimichthys crocea]